MNPATGIDAPEWVCIESPAYAEMIARKILGSCSPHGNKRSKEVVVIAPDGTRARKKDISEASILSGIDSAYLYKKLKNDPSYTARNGWTVTVA